MKKILYVLLIFLVIAAVFAVTKTGIKHNIPGVGCENNPNPVFTHFVTDLDTVELLQPPLMKSAANQSRSWG